ncbi:MAG TPA: PEP-CTERM sorting domain-containing protein, partial [Tepidisphaeraceae bacterium]|nr:PEP-CTERM sorting domain-containing protein [Tepidisphaeraceae bacterium]
LQDNGYVNGLTGWVHGDFDYSGVVDATDYALMDNAYVHQSGPLAEAMISEHTKMFGAEYIVALRAIQMGAIPEPTTLVPVVLLGTLLVRRRRP